MLIIRDLGSICCPGLQNEVKNTRMLLLELTDGVTEIYGMEYRPITKLSTRTLPGTKVQDTINPAMTVLDWF